MKQSFLLVCFLLVGVLFSTASPLAVELKAFAVEEVPGAEPVLTQTEVVKPGQLIEYQAVFTNISDGALNGVAPEIPIPAGMTVILQSIDPDEYLLSADSIHFAKGPLLDASGKPLGAELIRSVRWNPVKLDAGSKLTRRLRAKVNE